MTSNPTGPRSPRSRARTGTGTRAGARSGTRAASSSVGRSPRREQGPEGPIRSAAQILLGLTLSCSIGFLAFGILVAVIYLVYSMVK